MRVTDSFGKAVAPNGNLAVNRQRINGFDPYTIQPYGLLEGLGINLPARIHLARCIDELPERDTTAVVSHRNEAVGDGHLDPLASPHDVFVYGVIQDFFQEHVDPVIGVRTIPQLPDIHPRAAADMFVPF